MELLVLVLAVLIRAVFIRSGGKNWVQKRCVPILTNRFEGLGSEAPSIAAFVLLIAGGWLVQWWLGESVLVLITGLFFLYLFSALGQEDVLASVWRMKHQDAYRKGLLNALATLTDEDKVEDTGQPESALETRIRSLYLYQYFVSTFVLTFWYLLAGWIGVSLCAVVYNMNNRTYSDMQARLRLALEWIPGVLTVISSGIAGRFDSLRDDINQWRPSMLLKGGQLFELSVLAASDLDENDQVGFEDRVKAFVPVCIRGLYVWIFVLALIMLT